MKRILNTFKQTEKINVYKLVILISGNGSNLQQFIDHIESGDLNAEIVAVISNRANAYGLERAKQAAIPSITLDHTQFADRESFDHALAKEIDQYQPDLIILAGFMRILTEGFVEHFKDKLINIHPSLLPKYKGLHTHKRALQDKQSEHGASVHFVTAELDAGKVIVQGIVAVKANDTEETLANRVHQIEHIIYPKAVKLLQQGKIENIETPVKVYL